MSGTVCPKKRILIIIICITLIGPIPAAAQDSAGSSDYEPYMEEEFPPFLIALRRAEVVFFGSFPLTMLATTLVYEGYRRTAMIVAPTDDRLVGIGTYSTTEEKWILLSGVIISTIISVVDAIIESTRSDSDDEN